VDPNGRLELNHLEGTVAVTTWGRSEMRVVATYDGKGALEIRSSGSKVRIALKGEWGEPVEADFRITVPRGMALEITGLTLDVSVQGAGGDLSISSVDGEIVVDGGRGNVTLSSVAGDVSVRGARANVSISSVDGDITVSDTEGDVEAQAVDGDITLEGIRSVDVTANSVDGDISYRGTIADGGRYLLSTHDGDLTLAVPEGANARVSVSTFAGEIDAEFPIEIEGDMSERSVSFTLGSGKARVELSAFDGTISLVRP
jgi:DUF4097 and DUF4098 domain-containing protein YvlB